MPVPFLLFPLDEDSNQERNDLLNECSGRWGHRPGKIDELVILPYYMEVF